MNIYDQQESLLARAISIQDLPIVYYLLGKGDDVQKAIREIRHSGLYNSKQLIKQLKEIDKEFHTQNSTDNEPTKLTSSSSNSSIQCQGTIKSGQRCCRMVKGEEQYCWSHKP